MDDPRAGGDHSGGVPDALLQDYEVDPSKLRLDLDLFIGQLVEHELVEDAEHAPDREPR